MTGHRKKKSQVFVIDATSEMSRITAGWCRINKGRQHLESDLGAQVHLSICHCSIKYHLRSFLSIFVLIGAVASTQMHYALGPMSLHVFLYMFICECNIHICIYINHKLCFPCTSDFKERICISFLKWNITNHAYKHIF